MAHVRIALLVIGAVLIAQSLAVAETSTPAASVSAAAAPVCNGKYKGGLRPSAAELKEILKQHAAWVDIGGWYDELANDPRRANLCGADLRQADLEGADLTGAQVSRAKLAGVDLTGATYGPASEPPDPYVAGIKGLAAVNALPVARAPSRGASANAICLRR
jgi:hypothetical protein